MKKLTFGMATCDDYDGVFFTIQSVLLYHKEVVDEIEFLVIDNNPTGEHGKRAREFITSLRGTARYIPFGLYKSTSIRNKVFEMANTEYVLCVDSHVMLETGSIKRLIDFFEAKLDDGNLLQGPLVHHISKSVYTNFKDVWANDMWGTWGEDPRGQDPDAEPFEIQSQGLGLFACRKDSWLGFNKAFRGFGGEEGYIHEKYRRAGKKTLCLPFLRWIHRFGRTVGATNLLYTRDRVRNYIIGFREVGLDTAPVIENFRKTIKPIFLDKWLIEIEKELAPKDSTTKVIVVGNGTSIKEKENGKLIDGFDRIIRFNNFSILGYENFVGTKVTDWWNVSDFSDSVLEEKFQNKFDNLVWHSWTWELEKDEPFRRFEKFAKSKGYNRVEKTKSEIITEMREYLGNSYYAYSTGLIAIWTLLKIYQTITITGFDWWRIKEHHYNKDGAIRGDSHKPEIEKVFIDKLIYEGRIKLL